MLMRYLRQAAIASLLALASFLALALPLQAQDASQGADVVSRDRVLRDPDIPATGNPKGDITIVEFFDYQCPYCKAIHPDFKKAVEEDGKVRVVSKNWPIFGDVSVYAARLALAAKYQNKYAEAHEALISAPTKLDEARVQELLAKAGVDVKRAQDDLQKNAKTIDAALARTNEQAEALGFRGTPSFIFNTLRFSGVLDGDGFKEAFAAARKAKAEKK
jgi:protein-disulfide isomerase